MAGIGWLQPEVPAQIFSAIALAAYHFRLALCHLLQHIDKSPGLGKTDPQRQNV